MTTISKECADRIKLAERLRDISHDAEDLQSLLKTLEILERRGGKA